MPAKDNKPERSTRKNKEINLRDYADRTCKKCYGRGHRGGYPDGTPIVCACVKRNYRNERQFTITPETLVKDIVRLVKS